MRRSRRNRKVRYRKARFKNRRRAKGWLPPSLVSRIDNVYNWGKKLINLSPIAMILVETARFDTQKLMNPEISGIKYQQGTLQGYEIREYLLEKWKRKFAQCDKSGVPLQIEHIHPKSKYGIERISNLVMSCMECNMNKGDRNIRSFLAHNPARLARILTQAKRPLKDAALVNGICNVIAEALKLLGLPISFYTGNKNESH